DIVILTFVSNDISDLRGKSRQEVAEYEILFHQQNVSPFRRASMWFFTSTGVGEMIFRLYWTLFVPKTETHQPTERSSGGDTRYVIRGGGDYERNAETFRRRFSSTDGMVLTDEFSNETRQLLDNYVHVLGKFVATCHDHNIVPVFVYFPSYTQVYDPATSTRIQQVLREICRRLSMPFLDLTDALRSAGRDKVLHLAPVDYHPNPDGNEVIARAMFEFLRDENLVK
ncbi:MAG: SGNH/GDSL hydrolase family protein, partial [Candidatus Krumholzibacteria bacterium]|nr:SGNH/GDSL hydrolase family protein [Candidatus Krumholzibacteria bacterium]